MPVMLMVLNDGTTYTDLDGCTILSVEEDDLVRLDDGAEPDDLVADGTATVITRFDT